MKTNKGEYSSVVRTGVSQVFLPMKYRDMITNVTNIEWNLLNIIMIPWKKQN
ncbi:MAG TPA: hypothetical protein GX708_15750 [Gallicola sp.]|nr:hypothetical protein [Gallicola sp.]